MITVGQEWSNPHWLSIFPSHHSHMCTTLSVVLPQSIPTDLWPNSASLRSLLNIYSSTATWCDIEQRLHWLDFAQCLPINGSKWAAVILAPAKQYLDQLTESLSRPEMAFYRSRFWLEQVQFLWVCRGPIHDIEVLQSTGILYLRNERHRPHGDSKVSHLESLWVSL